MLLLAGLHRPHHPSQGMRGKETKLVKQQTRMCAETMADDWCIHVHVHHTCVITCTPCAVCTAASESVRCIHDVSDKQYTHRCQAWCKCLCPL